MLLVIWGWKISLHCWMEMNSTIYNQVSWKTKTVYWVANETVRSYFRGRFQFLQWTWTQHWAIYAGESEKETQESFQVIGWRIWRTHIFSDNYFSSLSFSSSVTCWRKLHQVFVWICWHLTCHLHCLPIWYYSLHEDSGENDQPIFSGYRICLHYES